MWSDAQNFEEEEEEEAGDLNDALLDALEPEDLADDEIVEGEIPLVPPVVDELAVEEEEDETAKAFFDGDTEEGEDDADLDYDSFDDKDDL